MEEWSTKAIYDLLFLFAFRTKGKEVKRESCVRCVLNIQKMEVD